MGSKTAPETWREGRQNTGPDGIYSEFPNAQEPGPPQGWSPRDASSSDGLFWGMCLGLGLLARLVTVPPVFFSGALNGEVQPIGTDSLYHLRRIHEAVLNFPHLLTRDPYLSFPEVLPNPYEPGFDLLLASFSRLLCLSTQPSFQKVAALSAIAMPFLGLLVIPLYAAIARRLGGRESMRATGLLLALLPGVTFTGLAGQVDHHVLEPLVIGLPMLWVLQGLKPGARFRAMLLGGLSLGLSLFFWRGILLPAGILALFFGIRTVYLAALGLVDRLTRDEAPFMFLSAAVAAMLVSVLAPVQYLPEWSALTYFTISLQQPVILTLLAAGMYGMGRVAVQLAQRRNPEGIRTDLAIASTLTASGQSQEPNAPPLTRPPLPGWLELGMLTLALGLSGAGPLLLALLMWPDLAENFLAGLGFLARVDPFVLSVGEQRPLFTSDTGAFSAVYALYFYGAFGVLLPLIFRFGWRQGATLRALRLESRVLPDFRWLLLGLWTLVSGVMALTQRRYAAHFAPLYCVWVGMAFVYARDLLQNEAQEGRRLPLTIGTIGATLLTLPTFVMTGAMAATATQPPALLEAVQWIGNHTPPTAGFHLSELEAGQRPEYGILSAWDEGHHLVALAHRPNVGNPFGVAWFMPSIRRNAAFWLAPAAQLAQSMDETRARFALVSFRLGLLADEALFLNRDPDTFCRTGEAGLTPGPGFWSLGVTQLYVDRPQPDAPGLPADWRERDSVPGVRVIWQGGLLEPDAPALRFVARDAPAYRVIERVAGARVTGKGPPGARVVATQAVVMPSRRGELLRPFLWRTSTRVGPDGRFELRAVYAHRGAPPGYAQAQGSLLVEVGSQALPFEIDENTIQSGGNITFE